MKKIVTLTVVLLILTAACFSLAACNDDEISLSDIYKNNSDVSELTSYKTEFTLPAGWSVYVTSSSTTTDFGYLKQQNMFIIKNDVLDNSTPTTLSVMKCGDSRVYFPGGIAGMLFPEDLAISAIRVSGNLIAVKRSNGVIEVYDINGKRVVDGSHFVASTSLTLDKILKILDDGLIAVAADYSADGEDGYTSIIRPSSNGGELVCRVKNASEKLENVDGFEKNYVSVTGNAEDNFDVNRMFRIPDTAGSSVLNMNGGTYGTFVEDDDVDDYYCEITYIGNGDFFVHEDWIVTSDDDYTYYDGTDYIKAERHIYDADKDRMTTYNSSYMFLSLTNKFYNENKTGIDSSTFLNDGYMYAAYGLTVSDNKIGYYDQFILDEDLNIVLSLSSNFGVTLKDVDLDDIGAFDLMLDFVDGKGYIPVSQSRIKMYDYKTGETLFTNTDITCSAASYSNGMLVCAEDIDGTVYYGALDSKGDIVVPFEKYTALLSFRGYYTAGIRSGSTLPVLIGKDGAEVTSLSDGTVPFSDIATTTANKYIYKVGCYMYKKTTAGSDGKDVTLYGIKNFNANVSKSVIMEAKMSSGSTLYSPSDSPEDVFVFEKITSGSNTVYTVYRLM